MDNKNTERRDENRNNLWDFDDFIRCQLKIAKRWLQRGNKVKDIFSKFFFYFAGFNAIYFLWGKIDKLNQHKEISHIINLLEKIDEAEAQVILNKVKISIKYFCRRNPIQEMRKRTCESPYEGDKTKGDKCREILQNNKRTASERVIALGEILYLVRCNLVHGSKEISGDDKEIIKKSIDPLKIFLEEAISWTRLQCP
jgi:hypothetical protein